eukprot:1491678-Alexandrium_andersonii.AAC.1
MRRAHPSRALGIMFEAVSGPAQFKLRTRQAISHVLGSECPTAIGISFTGTETQLPGRGSAI